MSESQEKLFERAKVLGCEVESTDVSIVDQIGLTKRDLEAAKMQVDVTRRQCRVMVNANHPRLKDAIDQLELAIKMKDEYEKELSKLDALQKAK